MRKFASSPAHIELEERHRNASFNKHTITPSIGPSKKEMSNMNTLPKSNFKKGVAGKMGISKKSKKVEIRG